MPSEINLGDVQNDALQSLEAKIATDSNGDFVIEDSNENVVARYDEANSTWVLTSLSADESRTNVRTETLNVPSDLATVSDAIDEVRAIRTPPGVEYEINIESGHAIQEEIELFYETLDNVVITSEDSTVSADSSFPADTDVMRLVGSIGPRWDIFLDGSGNADRDVLNLLNQSAIIVQRDAPDPNGGTNCRRGANVDENSFLFAQDADFSGNNDRGISATRNAIVFAQNADLSGNGNLNLRVGSQAFVNCVGADLTGAGDVGLRATSGPVVIAADADMSGATNECVYASGVAFLDLSNATADDSGGNGVELIGGEHNLGGISISNATAQGVRAEKAATVKADNVSISGASANGVLSQEMAQVFVGGGASVTGSSNNDLAVARGGLMSLHDCETTSSTGSDPHTDDMNASINTLEGTGIIFAQNFESP